VLLHGSAPVTRAERCAITLAAAFGVQDAAHASPAIIRRVFVSHGFRFSPSACPFPRLAALASI
jgi:hypothetical protein